MVDDANPVVRPTCDDAKALCCAYMEDPEADEGDEAIFRERCTTTVLGIAENSFFFEQEGDTIYGEFTSATAYCIDGAAKLISSAAAAIAASYLI